MIYLETSCWSLAQRSHLMTLEQDIKSEEKCNLRPAKAGHLSNICLQVASRRLGKSIQHIQHIVHKATMALHRWTMASLSPIRMYLFSDHTWDASIHTYKMKVKAASHSRGRPEAVGRVYFPGSGCMHPDSKNLREALPDCVEPQSSSAFNPRDAPRKWPY